MVQFFGKRRPLWCFWGPVCWICFVLTFCVYGDDIEVPVVQSQFVRRIKETDRSFQRRYQVAVRDQDSVKLKEATRLRIIEISEVLKDYPPESWQGLNDDELVLLGEALLYTRCYSALLDLSRQMIPRSTISLEMHRKEIQALVFLKELPAATKALADSQMGESGGRLGEFHFLLLSAYSTKRDWCAAIDHGDRAMRHLKWQVDHEPQRISMVKGWVKAYAVALSQCAPDLVHPAMKRVMDRHDVASESASDTVLSRLLDHEVGYCAACECGSSQEQLELRMRRWTEELGQRSPSAAVADRLLGSNRLLMLFEFDQTLVTENRDVLSQVLDRLDLELPALAGDSSTRSAIIDVGQRCARLRAVLANRAR